MPREIVLDVLAREEVGGFVVRESTTHSDCYALSVKVPKSDHPSNVAHYLIQRTQRGVKLKVLFCLLHLGVVAIVSELLFLQGLDKEWPSLHSLVVHLTVMPEMLPCPLKVPRRACNPGFQTNAHEEIRATGAGLGSLLDSSEAHSREKALVQPQNPRGVATNDFIITGLDVERIDVEDEDYQRLSDFSSIMADLRVK